MSTPLTAAEIYRRYNAAENQHDSMTTAKLVASDLYVEINGVVSVASADDDAKAMDELYACYPDYRRDILEIIDADDRAAAVWNMKGTPSASLALDLEPLDVKGVSILTGNGHVLTRASLFVESGALSAVLERAKRARENMGQE